MIFNPFEGFIALLDSDLAYKTFCLDNAVCYGAL